MPACAWFGIDPATVRRILTARFGPGADNWVMALLQWYAYGGLYLGPLAALALVAAWHRRRWKRRLRAEPSPEGASPRPAWRATLAAVAASAWAMMILLLLLYLACTPWLLGDMEAQYQQQMVYYRNPPQYWAAVRDTINALKSAPQIITQPRAEAAADAAPAPAGD